ncbi:MAG TPA: type II CAAX endopeptidase family protein [Propionibacteriaceae bacterium]
MTTVPRRPAGSSSQVRRAAVAESDPTSTAGPASWSHRHQLGLFFGLAFLLSWLPWPLVLLNPDSSPMVPFGPLVAAVVTVLLTGGMPNLRRLLSQLSRWRLAFRWYLLALAGPPLVLGLAAALTVAAGARTAVVPAVEPAQVAAIVLSTLILIGLFEEVGWRGFALPRLQQRLGQVPAALLLGVIWALWHLPELISDPTGQRPAIQFLVTVVAQSVFLTWLYNRTSGSLPIVILAHTTVDSVGRFVLPSFTGDGYQLVWWVLAGLCTLAAASVTVIGTRRPSPYQETLR